MSAPSLPITDQDREIAAGWCVRLADGALSADDHLAFRTWLDSSTANPGLFERSVAAWQAIDEQAGRPEMLAMRSQALNGMRRANRIRWAWIRPGVGWREAAMLAACLVLAVGAGLWWHVMPARYQTGIGERRVVALADGSSLSLDAASEVDVRYLEGRRRLWLRKGRAMFTVAKDPLRPFSVEAGDRMVVATGTRFSVEKLKGQVRVVLFEGHVAVTGLRAGTMPAAPIRLRDGAGPADEQLVPGREMVVAETAPVAQVATIDPAQAAGWEAGLLQFSDQPLALAVQQMDRYSPVRLKIGDAAAAAIPISGQFRSGDTEAFVEGVTAVFPITAEKNPDGEIVFHHKLVANSPVHSERIRRAG
jgi:transmembrane sensor